MMSTTPARSTWLWIRSLGRGLGRWLAWSLVALLALQLFFAGRIALMAWADPHSTAFMRSEIWRRSQSTPARAWAQQWVPWEQLSPHLKRAVIAAEDDKFKLHSGVDWPAVESAWSKNRKRTEQANRNPANSGALAKLVGGSTITQQLAKNLLLSGERNLWRKGQELLLTFWLEALLDKRRILEIYLNSVEWGDGVFGAEAAARRYFGVGAGQLAAEQAARLAVMLPAPKTFEKRPQSAYLTRRTETILGRMGSASIP